MIIIPHRKIWTRQPQRPVEIDQSNSITDGLVRRWSLGVSDIDAVSKTPFSHSGSPKYSTTSIGKLMSFNGSPDVINTGIPTSDLNGQEITISLWAIISGAQNNSILFGGESVNRINVHLPYDGVVYWDFGAHGGGNNRIYANMPSNYVGALLNWVFLARQNYLAIYLNGDVFHSATPTTPGYAGSGNLFIGAFTNELFFTGSIGNVSVFNRALEPGEIKSLYRFQWQLDKRTIGKIFLPDDAGGDGAVLEANAQSATTATGSLTTAIPIAGAAASLATATGSLTTAIQLSGSAASVSIADGLLTTQIRLSGDAIMQALATGSLDASSASLAAVGSSTVTATGQLTTEIRLSGAAIMEALATAGLTTSPLGLSADAIASASASANLTTGIPLLADASAIAIGSAGLTTGIQLSAAAASVSNATGDLTVTLSPGMSAAAFAEAIASGTLSTQIQLSAAATMQALATASLVSAWLVDSQLQRSLFFRRRANQYFFRRS